MAAAAVMVGCGGTVVPNGPVELDKLRRSAIPVWYLGESFAGFDLTFADKTAADEVMLTYGTCKTPEGILGSDGGCGPPLELVSCKGSDVVVIFPRGALVRKAAKALRPLNDAARRIGKPYVQIDYGSC